LAGKGGKRRSEVQPTPEEQLAQSEDRLKAPETDWDEIYIRLRSSVLKDDFDRERFVRTPIGVLNRALEYVEDEEQRRANINAATTANLIQVVIAVAHGFSGAKGKAPSVNMKDFLPFPEWQPRQRVNSNGPDSATKFVLTKLMRNYQIPVHVFSSMISEADGAR
jgi:hypothetical protein